MSHAQGTETFEHRIFNDPELLGFARAARAGGAGASIGYVRLVRRVRERSRHDLTRTCLLLLPPGASAEAMRELILLLIDVGAIDELRPLLASIPESELTLPASALRKLLERQEHAATVDPRRIQVWPNESMPHAAKTSIFQVQEAVICRQKALIEKLLSQTSGQGGAG